MSVNTEDDSSTSYLPRHSHCRASPILPRQGRGSPELDSVFSSELDFSAEESSIHTSDYGSSSFDTSIMMGGSTMYGDCDTLFDGDKKGISSSSKASTGENSAHSTEESSSDWADVTDSSSSHSSEGSDTNSVRQEMIHGQKGRARSSHSSMESGRRSKENLFHLPEMTKYGRIRTANTASDDCSPRLEHVDYLSQIDVASHDLTEGGSFRGPIRKLDAHSAFQHEVPHEIPVKDTSDELSSIGAVSQPPKRKAQDEKNEEQIDVERGLDTVTSLDTLKALKDEFDSLWSAPQRSKLERFFIALVAISLFILVVLLILLLSQ